MSLARFAETATFNPETGKSDWYCPRHLEVLNALVMKVITGEITRLLTLMSPRHGKSEFLSAWLPVYYLGMFPDREVILASYNGDFAEEWGQKARDRMEEYGPDYFGLDVRSDRRSSSSWGLVDQNGKIRRGGLKTAGVNGGLTGKGASLLLIDDPVKDAADALSPAVRQSTWEWFAAAARTRMAPRGAICLTMTPWHADDLGGRILERQAERWTVLRIPGLAEEPIPPDVRATRKGYDALVGASDPLGRSPGEPIWPYDQDGREQFPVSHFEDIRQLDPFWFDALQMCHPRPRDGGFFKRSWFEGPGRIIAVPHRECRYLRFWDKAASQNKGDWTVGALVGERNGIYYVTDIKRFREAPGQRDAIMRNVSIQDQARYGESGYEIWVEQEAGGGGKSDAEATVRLLAGFNVHVEARSKGNKESGAAPFASQAEAGNVKLVAGDWIEPFLDELMGFPNGKHDDQVDAVSGAFNKLALDGGGRESALYDPTSDAFAEYGEVTF